MTPFEFSTYACAACGPVMVAGAIWLLRTGAIRLSEASKRGVFAVELERKIKISTSYPALGLFVIGLLFPTLALWYSKPAPLQPGQPLNIVGKLQIADPSAVTITLEPDLETARVITPDSDGGLDQFFPADIRRVKVLINAAGYSPTQSKFTLRVEDAKEQRLWLPAGLKFTKVIDAPATGDVAPLPATFNPPPLTNTPGF